MASDMICGCLLNRFVRMIANADFNIEVKKL